MIESILTHNKTQHTFLNDLKILHVNVQSSSNKFVYCVWKLQGFLKYNFKIKLCGIKVM